MSDYKERELIGSSKVITSQFGEFYKVGFNETQLNRLLEVAKSKGGWANVVVTKSKKGNAMCYVDDFVPTKSQSGNDDMPF